MNFRLNNIPERTTNPRSYGITMITDKGLGLQETKNLLSVAAPYIDFAKLAFGTSLFTPLLREKIELYQSQNIPVYLGGLLLEAFIIRNQFSDYIRFIQDFGITHIEMSDGSLNISHEEKCGYIEKLTKYGTVLSEVGSKDKDKVLVTPPYKWIDLMTKELSAGASYVIAEARETGTVGLFRDSGEVREGLVQEILVKIPAEKIIWETPQKDQQLYFIKTIGANVNLGNIATTDVIALEAMRIGLRSDTFELYLDK
ncbi:phosphosulfolactate synthase [Danxiaibacter flavus]|uniref:Phosphosulfolactate synthase n=1 Tax=Danxiaibacter flavus TaxID=3049108 RepID=A0ABV3ZIN7_9BACT|nr:phosphosulfolactate synthase [Chitinophagaceae bacterium DXS]